MTSTINSTSPKFSIAALGNIEATGVDYTADLARLRSGEITEEALLSECLDGAEGDDVIQGWHDYVGELESLLDLSPGFWGTQEETYYRYYRSRSGRTYCVQSPDLVDVREYSEASIPESAVRVDGDEALSATADRIEHAEIVSLVGDVEALVGVDGTADLRTIVECALADDATATAEDIAEIVREARRDAQAERDAG